MTNGRDGILYVGVTSNLPKRAWEHREGVTPGFTKRYGLKRLVYYEVFDDIRQAIQREKTHQALAACVEGAFDPRCKSGVGGFI